MLQEKDYHSLMILNRLLGRTSPASGVAPAYAAIVAAARRPAFYERHGVADTPDGRYDMIVLHAFLVLDRLRPEREFTQALADAVFADMDRSLREMGVGDVAVPKKVRQMAEAFYGRVAAYAAAVEGGAQPLAAALARNVFAGETGGDAAGLARYAVEAKSALAAQATAALLAGRIVFPELAP